MSDNLDIPAFLRREMTPEARASIDRLTKQLRRGTRRVEKNGQSTISTGYAIPADETGKALLREVLKSNASELQKDRARRALRKARGTTMPEPGPKEIALREQRSGKKKTKAEKLADAMSVSLAAPPKSNGSDPTPLTTRLAALAPAIAEGLNTQKADPPAKATAPEATTRESEVSATKTATKPAAKPSRKTAAPRSSGKKQASANARTPLKKSKMQVVEDMLLRPKGATREEMSKASGWPFVNLQTQLERYKKRFPKAKLVEENGRFKLTS